MSTPNLSHIPQGKTREERINRLRELCDPEGIEIEVDPDGKHVNATSRQSGRRLAEIPIDKFNP